MMKNKKLTRILAGALVGVMVAGAVPGMMVHAEDTANPASEQREMSGASEEELSHQDADSENAYTDNSVEVLDRADDGIPVQTDTEQEETVPAKREEEESAEEQKAEVNGMPILSDEDAEAVAASEEAQRTDAANSWRYSEGERLTTEESAGIATYAARSVTPWTNINGVYYNSFGDRIDGVVAKGMDVSQWNGTINWNTVKNSSDIDYAIIRCGYGDNYASQDDTQWSRNVSEAERVGIPYGVYIFSYAASVAQARSEAEHVLRLVRGHNPTYPIYLDLEYEFGGKPLVSNAKLAEIAKTFCDIIKNAGYKVGVYANTNWFNHYLTGAVFNNYPKWVAQYNYECTYSGNYTMWQFTSQGSVKGISGDVDLNLDFGTVDGNIAAVRNRLVQKNGKTYCYLGNEKVYGEQRVGGNWYYFDPKTGEMQTGFVNLGNKTVYYENDGAMCYGERYLNGKWYCFDTSTGAMKTGFVNLGNKKVYYGSDGTMRYGKQTIKGKQYYFDTKTGAMKKGFLRQGSKKVYYGTDGIMRFGEQYIKGYWYYFDPKTGVMQTGFVKLKNKTVYYAGNGVMLYGEQNINGNWYYFDPKTGAMKMGFVNLGNKKVYYGSDGIMRYGKQTVKGKQYYFDTKTGAMKKGFLKQGSKKFYYGTDGIMRFGEQYIKGYWYYFNTKTGVMHKGFLKLKNKTVYYGSDGVMRYGRQKINGKWYDFNKITGALQNAK